MHELLAFLLKKELYNRYASYSIKELLAGNRTLKVLYEVIRDLHETPGANNLSLEEVVLVSKDRLPDKPEATAELMAVASNIASVDLGKYSPGGVKAAFENAYRRNLAAYIAASALPALNNGEALDVASILQKLEEGSNTLSQQDEVVDYATYTIQPQTTVKTIPTFIKPLDDVIEGGLSPGQLATYVGWPGIGKTLLLHQSAALSFYHGQHACLITLEISKEDTCRRLDKLFGRGSDEYDSILTRARERSGKLTIVDGAADIFTPASVRSVLESLRRKGRPVDVLFIDYADLMETGRNLEDYNELGEVYRQLRRLGAKFEIPIWTASQAVRGSLQKQWLTMGDIADSFKKARIADLIVTINQTNGEADRGDLRLLVAKSRRNKGHPKVYLTTDFDRMRVVAHAEQTVA